MSKPHWYAPFKGKFDVLTADPDTGPLFCVSFNVAYAPFIRGAIFALLQRQMWEGTDAELDMMRIRVHQLLYIFGQQTDCPLPSDLTGEYDVMASLCESLRFQDGKLQALCCGEWTDVDGQLPGTGEIQPGGGTPVPGDGECVSYHVNLIATQQWSLPAPVNSGDVLTFSNPHGAAQDGSGSGVYYCPAGDIFFAGACTGVFGTNGADPAPLEAHMGTIVQINGVWYGTQTPITVPPGVVNKPAIFQVNDSSLADNSGGYNFDVEHCNNVTPSWCHTLDFKLSPHGFSIYVPAAETSGNSGHWVPGTGFVFGDSYQGAGPGEYFRRVAVIRSGITAFETVAEQAVLFDLTKGSFADPGEEAVELSMGVAGVYATPVTIANPAVSTGDGQEKTGLLSQPNTDSIFALIVAASSTPSNTLSGNAVLTGIRVCGKGPDPFA